jgi:5'-3' exonuclease
MKLLIDADILLYKTSVSAERETHWGNDLWTLHSDAAEVKSTIEQTIKALEDRLEAEYSILCFSDTVNFRKSVYPDYKGNRRGQRKPLAYAALKEWCLDTFVCEMWPTLEADDVMGIMATSSPGDYIICSDDKDLQQIPGLYYKAVFPTTGLELKTISEHDGLLYLFTQAITGDATDGYPGCPGAGPAAAQKALGSIRWTGDSEAFTQACWSATKSLYARQNLTPEDALVQLRCAKMLTKADWDSKNQQVILFDPDRKTI